MISGDNQQVPDASVGIAMGAAGSDVALEMAGIALRLLAYRDSKP